MTSVSGSNKFLEDEYGQRIDRCITDALIKAGRIIIS